jgi:uncharacterized protein DUF4386
MNINRSFQRFAALIAIASFFTAMTSNVLQGIPVHFNPDVATHPVLFLAVTPASAGFLRWGLILDMLGYYLPLLPIVLFLNDWFKSQNPIWVRFYTTCAVGFIFIGAVGAVTLAVTLPLLINAYAQASGDQRAALESIFGVLWTLIYAGLWNILGELLIGIWFLGAGLLLKSERRLLGIVGMIVGISSLLDSFGNILGISGLALLGLSVYLILAPIWVLWFGIDLLRKPVQIG